MVVSIAKATHAGVRRGKGYVMKVRTIAVSCVALSLTGCIAVWGGAYHVESESLTSVTIRYDAAVVGVNAVRQRADESCGRNRRIAMPISQRMGVVLPGGSIGEIVFDCDDPEEAARDHAIALQDMVFSVAPAPVAIQAPPRIVIQSVQQPPQPAPVPILSATSPSSYQTKSLSIQDFLNCTSTVHVPYAYGEPDPCR